PELVHAGVIDELPESGSGDAEELAELDQSALDAVVGGGAQEGIRQVAPTAPEGEPPYEQGMIERPQDPGVAVGGLLELVDERDEIGAIPVEAPICRQVPARVEFASGNEGAHDPLSGVRTDRHGKRNGEDTQEHAAARVAR